MFSRLARYALGAGLIAALIEATMILAVDPRIDPWMIAQASLFWFGCGVVSVRCDLGLPVFRQAQILTLLLFTPWLINEVVMPGQWSHLVPMVLQALVFGLLFGAARRRALR